MRAASVPRYRQVKSTNVTTPNFLIMSSYSASGACTSMPCFVEALWHTSVREMPRQPLLGLLAFLER